MLRASTLPRPTGKFLPWLHIVGNRTYAIEHGKGLLVMDPGFDCPDFMPADASAKRQCTLSRLIELAESKSMPITHLFLSHRHPDHAENLNAFLTMRLNHQLFQFIVVASERSHVPALMKSSGIPTISVVGDMSLNLPAGPVDIICTPGHSENNEDICVFFPGKRALFAGDLIQPQGKSYDNCDFDTPFSNHQDGTMALESLARLRGLNFSTLLMGHDGTVMNREEGIEAISITEKVLLRTRELTNRLISENPGQSSETYVEWVHDTIAWERGLPRERSEIRKISGHKGQTPPRHPKSFYHLYDTPSIRHFVDMALRD